MMSSTRHPPESRQQPRGGAVGSAVGVGAFLSRVAELRRWVGNMPSMRSMQIVAILVCAASAHGAQTRLVVGTYQKGNNVTEPRPNRSAYLETLHGGIVVMGDGAGYYLFTRVMKKPDRELYVTVEYENPLGGEPFVNDMVFRPTMKELHFSAPQFITGLRSYCDYEIVVRVFESKSASQPIDTLKQTVRSYVDTRGSKPQMFKQLKERP